MKTCDLHTHSTASDGEMTPAGLVEEAVRVGLSAIALTDHNTTAGLAEFSSASARQGILGVCGCEFTTEHEGCELHLHGLFLPEECWPALGKYVEGRNEAKRESNRICLERLFRDGYPVSPDDLLARYPEVDAPNRKHIASLLMEAGVVQSISEAFSGLLAEGAGYYVPAEKLPFLGTIEVIRTWGALPVWAHPLGNPGLTRGGVAELLPIAKERGLIGAEAYYTTYSPDDQRFMVSLCEECGIVDSGGSDFHGSAKPEIALGVGFGSLRVPFSSYESLLEFAG